MGVPDGDRSAGTNLERSADTEDTVVGFLSRKTLDSSLDDVVLFGDYVVEPSSSQYCSSVDARQVRTSGDWNRTNGK